ncbi:MAG: hypothetical protein BYD32DRAFT_440612 [Podila humilis]|nr:MAG: hypothetical protein BYD32DRAFT_440612 [Podila humilis]
MSRRELNQLKRLTPAEVNSPRKLRTRRNVKPENMSKPSQDAVFSLPELQAIIVASLTEKDLVSMMATCRAWFNFCAPVLYKTLSLQRHKNTGLDSIIKKYGDHVQHLHLDHANILLEPVFHSIGLLHNLRTLHWNARGRLIHVIHLDEILSVLQSCPLLVSLHLGEVNVLCTGHDSSISETSFDTGYPSPPGSPEPIVETKLDGLFSGHQLQELTLSGTRITDEGLLRLLGIGLEPVHHIDSRPALTRLGINSNGPTHKSGARILQECNRLKVLMLQLSGVASVELFQGDAIWPSAPLIKKLSLDLTLGMDSEGVPVTPSDIEKKQILTRLQSMVSLEEVKISGYPIDFAVVESMSFTEQL